MRIVVFYFKFEQFFKSISRDNTATFVSHVNLDEILYEIVDSVVSLMIIEFLVQIFKAELELFEVCELRGALNFFLNLHKSILSILRNILRSYFRSFVIKANGHS